MPANIFGPYGDFSDEGPLMNALIGKAVRARDDMSDLRILGTGRPRRQLVYSRDFARLLIGALEHYDDASEPLIVAGSQEHSVQELAHVAAAAVGFGGPFRNVESRDGPLRRTVTTTKLQQLFPTFEETPLEQAANETACWYMALLRDQQSTRNSVIDRNWRREGDATVEVRSVDRGNTANATTLTTEPFVRRDSKFGMRRTLWSSDFHIGTIADLKSLFASKFNLSIIDESLSAHCHLKHTCHRPELKVRKFV